MIGWGEEAPGEGLTRTWTGVMGYTIDRLPYIGPMPEKDDLYLAAGFNVSSVFDDRAPSR